MTRKELLVAEVGAFLSGLALAFDGRLGRVLSAPIWLVLAGATLLVVALMVFMRRISPRDGAAL